MIIKWKSQFVHCIVLHINTAYSARNYKGREKKWKLWVQIQQVASSWQLMVFITETWFLLVRSVRIPLLFQDQHFVHGQQTKVRTLVKCKTHVGSQIMCMDFKVPQVYPSLCPLIHQFCSNKHYWFEQHYNDILILNISSL